MRTGDVFPKAQSMQQQLLNTDLETKKQIITREVRVAYEDSWSPVPRILLVVNMVAHLHYSSNLTLSYPEILLTAQQYLSTDQGGVSIPLVPLWHHARASIPSVPPPGVCLISVHVVITHSDRTSIYTDRSGYRS